MHDYSSKKPQEISIATFRISLKSHKSGLSELEKCCNYCHAIYSFTWSRFCLNFLYMAVTQFATMRARFIDCPSTQCITWEEVEWRIVMSVEPIRATSKQRCQLSFAMYPFTLLHLHEPTVVIHGIPCFSERVSGLISRKVLGV